MKTLLSLCISLLFCGCSKGDFDSFPATIVGNEVYNAYQAKSTWVVRISKDQVEDIIRTDPKNPLALFVAATRGDVALSKGLLNQGADPNQPTTFGQYPIHEAARGGFTSVLDVLLAAGANVNVRISAKGRDGPNQWTPLHFAAYSGNVEIAEKLLAKGADPKPRDYWGITPLQYARQQKHASLIKLLQEQGAKE